MGTPEMSNSGWWVCVRYGGDCMQETVRLRAVKHFNPCTMNDYVATKLYKIKTKKWNVEGKSETYQGVIEGIGANKEGAEAQRRANLKNYDPILKDHIQSVLKKVQSAPVTNTSDAGVDQDPIEQEVQKQGEAKAAANLELEASLLNKSRLRLRPPPVTASPHPDADSEASDSTVSPSNNTVNKVQKRKKRMIQDPEAIRKAKLERKEQNAAVEKAGAAWCDMLVHLQEERNAQQSTPPLAPIVHPIPSRAPLLAPCSHRCKTCGQEWHEGGDTNARLSKIEKNIDLILGLLQKPVSTSSSKTILYGKEVTDGKVLFTEGYTCSDICWRQMNELKEIPDWCSALLRGVLGEKSAKEYRLNPRYKNFKAFSSNFLSAAKVYYSDFLKRRATELSVIVEAQPLNKLAQVQLDHFLENHDKLVAQLGASLSDRADSMWRQWVNQMKKSGMPLPHMEKKPLNPHSPKSSVKRTTKLLTTPKSIEPRVRRTKKEDPPHENSKDLVDIGRESEASLKFSSYVPMKPLVQPVDVGKPGGSKSEEFDGELSTHSISSDSESESDSDSGQSSSDENDEKGVFSPVNRTVKDPDIVISGDKTYVTLQNISSQK